MEGIFKRPPLFRELILHSNGSISDDPSGHQVLRLKRSKSLGKHSIGDIGDGGLD